MQTPPTPPHTPAPPQVASMPDTWTLQRTQQQIIFALRSFLIRLPSTFQNFFTFTLFSGSSALLQTPECSEYHPSAQKVLSGQRSFSYQAPFIWNQLPVSVRHSASVSSFKSSLKTFNFLKTFSSVSLPWYATGACVCVCACVRARACVGGESVCVRAYVCVRSCLMRWILTICICKKKRVSA